MKGKSAPKISTEQLCRDYYDTQIFNPNGDFDLIAYAEILKTDLGAFFTEKTQQINADTFILELSALNIELFGFAWFEHNYQLCLSGEIEQGEADFVLCAEIVFAKSYSSQTIWSAAGFYNDTIFQARTAQKNSRNWSVPKDAGYWRKDVLSETKSEKLIEASTRDYYDARLADKGCALRLANRLLSVGAWREGVLIPQQLSSAFAQRLNFSPNIEALLLLQRLTVGLYKNAKDYIDAVIAYGSWKVAREESDNMMKHIIKVVQKDVEEKKKNGTQ